MEVGIALVTGLIIGWLVEWVIDWQYWRRGVAGYYARERQLMDESASKQHELDELNSVLEQTRNELSAARAQLQASKAKEAKLQQQLNENVGAS